MSLQTARALCVQTLAAIDAATLAETVRNAASAAHTTAVQPAPAPAPSSGGLTSPAAFYDHLRGTTVLGPVLTQSEVAGCDAILTACAGKMPLPWAAYALATAYHETAGTMQPIKEYGGSSYFRRMYDLEGDRPDKARELGNVRPGDGALFAGRGYVQLTGRTNYRRAGAELNLPIEQDPDLAMTPPVAAAVMVRGMLEGWFTGKKLNDYIPAVAERKHYAAARRIINGTDKADLIAGYALTFEAALKAGGWK